MDAEVLLGPPVMADVNGNNKLANAELEVLKLQELVRKLEKQNEQLRSRANAVNNCPVASRHHHPLHNHLHLQTGSPPACLAPAREPFPAKCESQCPREPFAYFQPSSSSPDSAEEEENEAEDGATTVLDEVDVLDLNTVLTVSEPDSCMVKMDAAMTRGNIELLASPPSSIKKTSDGLVEASDCDLDAIMTVLAHHANESYDDMNEPKGEDEPLKAPHFYMLFKRLYVSTKAKQHGGDSSRGLSPLQWCRQVLDHPGPEVELARMTLCHRLDQAKRWRGVSSVRPHSCIYGLSTLSCPILPYSKPAAITDTTALTLSPLSSGPALPLRPSLSLDRAPTFLSNSTLHNVGQRHATISPQSSLDSEAGISEMEDDSISMGYKLQDMTDVEVMARLQEESLRQDYASTSATVSRRCSSFSLNSLRRSDVDLEEDDEEDEDEGYDQLPPPQPRLFRTGSVQRGALPHSHTFSSFRDCRRSSTASSFSLGGLAPYTGAAGLSGETHVAYRNSADIRLRRSMPNLMRAPSMPSVPSIPSVPSMQCLASPVNPPSHGPSSLPTMSSLRSSLSFDSSSSLARLQSSIPLPGQLSQRVQSVGNFPATSRQPLKATAYVSPTVLQGPSALSSSTSLHSIPGSTPLPQPLKPTASSVPQPIKTPAAAAQSAVPRSSLPRPASFVALGGAPRSSKITQPTRSLLTPPKSLTSLSTLRDASWKDGCY